MGISGPNVNANKVDGIIIKDRRQLLVKVGSFMKSSWRRSTDKITDLIDDKDNKNSNDDDDDDDDIKNNRRRRRKHNFFVQFDDEVYVIPTSPSSCSFDTFISTRDNNTRNNQRQETQIQIQTQPMSETEPNEEQEQEEEEEIPSSSWYQSDDYCRFKKDMILNSLNYINAKRASKVFDEEKYSIRGIRHMCSHASGDPNYRRRQTSEKKYLYKVIRDEQNKQQKQNCASSSTKNPYTKYDMDKFRFVSLTQTKNGRDRAISLGNEYAREQRQQQQKDEQQQHQRNNNNNNNNTNTNNRGGGGFTSSPSMKNLISLGRQIQNNKVKRTDD